MSSSKKQRILQYVAYAPPHIGWYETHLTQWAEQWVKEGYGECLVATYSVWQPEGVSEYSEKNYRVIVIPAFEIITNFPFPKFRTKEYRQAHKTMKEFNPDIVVTRTRFFLSSLFGWLRARWHRKQRVHIEHGSEYVKLATPRKSACAWLYDQTIGRIVLRTADLVLGVSTGAERFVHRFTSRVVPVIHRGMDFNPQPWIRNVLKEIVHIGFVGRIVSLKWLDIFLRSCANIREWWKTNFMVTIIGDGDERSRLEQLAKELTLTEYVAFVWFKSKQELETERYPRFDIMINPSYQEWLPTSVLEGLFAQCVVVATNVGGTNEITDKEDLLLSPAGDQTAFTENLLYALEHYPELQWRSQARVIKKFSWSSNIEAVARVFEKHL